MYLGLMHKEKLMKMLSSIKNSNRMFLIQNIVLITIKFCLTFVWVRENQSNINEDVKEIFIT